MMQVTKEVEDCR